jgi:hypothetical protein
MLLNRLCVLDRNLYAEAGANPFLAGDGQRAIVALNDYRIFLEVLTNIFL